MKNTNGVQSTAIIIEQATVSDHVQNGDKAFEELLLEEADVLQDLGEPHADRDFLNSKGVGLDGKLLPVESHYKVTPLGKL